MKILIAGDYCPLGRVADSFEKDDYDTVLGDICKITSQVDYSIVNLECPVIGGDEKPIIKSGPNLKCSEKGVKAIKTAGFNCITLANNHFCDYGKDGVSFTLNTCFSYGIDYVGGGMDIKEASRTLFRQIAEQTVAVINCCEHEFSIASEKSAGSNPLNPIQQYYAIKDARKKADYVIVIVHGGHEHYNLPSPRMVEIYRFFIDSGADAVVNHHQHCYSGYEIYQGKPIFYGIGNFCFDKLRDSLPSSWCKGYMVELIFDDKPISFKLLPYTQCELFPSVKLMNDQEYKLFYENINQKNEIIANPILLERLHEEWMTESGSSFEHQFLPYSNRWFVSAYTRHLFPSFLPTKKILKLFNHIECESHRELSIFALKKMLYKHNSK